MRGRDHARVVRADEHVRRPVGRQRQMDAVDGDAATGNGPAWTDRRHDLQARRSQVDTDRSSSSSTFQYT